MRAGRVGSHFVHSGPPVAASWSEVPDSPKLSFQLEEVPDERHEELLQPHLEGGLLYRQYLADKFGFRSYSTGEEAVGMGLAEAKALVEKDRGHPIAFKLERVVLNDDLIYLPYTPNPR